MPLLTPSGTVSFPCVFKPSDFSGKYEVILVFPPEADLSVIEDELERAIKEAFASKRPKGLKYPLQDVSEKDVFADQFPEGSRFCRFKTNRRPKIVDGAREPIENEDGFYPGCQARAIFSAYAGTHPTGGAYAILNFSGIQRTGAGKRIGSSQCNPEEDFDAVEEECSDLF